MKHQSLLSTVQKSGLEECRHNNLIPQSQKFLLWGFLVPRGLFLRLPLRKDPVPPFGVPFSFR